MGNTFEQVDDVPTDAFPVVGKATANDSWTLVGIKPTEAEATQLAETKVGPPDNYFAARVCLPIGAQFRDAQ